MLPPTTRYRFRLKESLVGARILFVAFGGLVLVPLLTGLDASVALFTAGAGTLLFHWITGGRIPVFLASSFAFVSPIAIGMASEAPGGPAGGPPNTTYSEVTGAVALTRAFNPGILTWAAILAMALAFLGKLGALLSTIPPPVMGGVLVVLFGRIVVEGMNSLVEDGEDRVEPRNLIIAGVILVLGVGGMDIEAGRFSLEGLSLASVVGVALNLMLPARLGSTDPTF